MPTGSPDLAIGRPGKVTVLFSRKGAFAEGDSVELAVSDPRGLCAADLDQDGDDDLIAANYQTEGGATWTDSLIFHSDLGRLQIRTMSLALPTLGASWVSAQRSERRRLSGNRFQQRQRHQPNAHPFLRLLERGRSFPLRQPLPAPHCRFPGQRHR